MIAFSELGLTDYQVLAVDLAIVSFGEDFERAQSAMVEIPASKNKRTRPTTWVPKYTEEDFQRFLGIDPEDVALADFSRDTLADSMATDILRGAADWL